MHNCIWKIKVLIFVYIAASTRNDIILCIFHFVLLILLPITAYLCYQMLHFPDICATDLIYLDLC